MNDFSAIHSNDSILNTTEFLPPVVPSYDGLESNSSTLSALSGNVLRYEAEALTLSNYVIESNNASSSGEHISLLGGGSNSGTATGVFTGEAGIYQVKVGYYDENDGVSSARITVAGDAQNFLFDQDLPSGTANSTTLTERITHSAIELEQGDNFEIKGTYGGAEPARFDYIEFIFLEALPEPRNVRYEAEALTLNKYVIESNSASSSGKHISLLGGGSNSGTATGIFTGETGIYQVKVAYFDESDGVASATVTVGGNAQNFLFDQNLSSPSPNSATLTERITHSTIQLNHGDTFEIKGNYSGGEPARFDYIEFIAVNAPPSTYYVSPDGNNNNPGTIEQPWKTINYAVSQASLVTAGDTILVQPGVYTELITLNKSGSEQIGHITLKANGNVTLRDPDPINGGFREGVIQSAGKGYWTIDGFRIENTSWAGIALRDANNMIVKNNHTFETGASGIIVMPDSFFGGGDAEVTSKNIKILNNKVERANWRWTGRGDSRGTQEALSIWGVDGFEIANNIVQEGTREGIDVKVGSRNGSIHSNTVTGVAQVSGTSQGYNGGPAIYIEGSRANIFNIDVYNNLVYGNTADGIVIADEVPEQGDVRDIRVYNNVVYGNGILGTNGGVGIMVSSNVSDIKIMHNTVVNNLQSIQIDGTDFFMGYKTNGVVVRNNIFADAIYRNGFIEDADNIVLDNNLFTNNFDPYEGGSGLNNFIETNNIEVETVGFFDSVNQNYRLSSSSLAINMGSDLIFSGAFIDKDGKNRVQDDAPDIGAYEYSTST
ncbi:MAG: right-handed parallel beta-helix repeat-containing protein [Nostocales cyanobacterium 94392]|nr:right-handed parallel beta-helix repeat-containing protein [Nostocales cyanobacterium 94392]